MNEDIKKRFGDLMEKALDGALSVAEETEFRALLESSAEIFQLYLDSMDLHAGLWNHWSSSRETGAVADPAGERAPSRRPAVVFGTALAVAAGAAAIAAGWLMVGEKWQVARGKGQGVARVEAASGQWTLLRQGYGGQAVDGGQYGKKTALKVGDEVRVGDRIEVGEKGRVRLSYIDDGTTVELSELSKLSVSVRVPSVSPGKRLFLETGRLAIEVAEQPDGKPFTVETPHARAVIRGTAFSLGVGGERTRIEVTEGLVRFERLSDGESVDVATGQYAIAAEGVKLAALALSGLPGTVASTAAPASEQSDDYPAPRTDLDGELLFEEDFSDWRNNWELVSGNEIVGFRPAAPDAAQYVNVRKDGAPKGVQCPYLEINQPSMGSMAKQKDYVLLGIRSRQPIEADRFVVEIRLALAEGYGCYMRGIEIEDDVAVRSGNVRSLSRKPRMYRWEFTPAEDGPRDGRLLCRYFTVTFRYDNPRGRVHRRTFVYSVLVSSASRKIVAAFGGKTHIYDIVVRELR